MHQQTVYPATLATIPSLVSLAAPVPALQPRVVVLAGDSLMGGASALANDPSHASLAAAYRGALATARGWCLRAIRSLTPAERRDGYAEALTTAFIALHAADERSGLRLARSLESLHGGEIELQGACSACGRALLMWWDRSERTRTVQVPDASEAVPWRSGRDLHSALMSGERHLAACCRPGSAAPFLDREDLLNAAGALLSVHDVRLGELTLQIFSAIACLACGTEITPAELMTWGS